MVEGLEHGGRGRAQLTTNPILARVIYCFQRAQRAQTDCGLNLYPETIWILYYLYSTGSLPHETGLTLPSVKVYQLGIS
jgi:hypothetical protein